MRIREEYGRLQVYVEQFAALPEWLEPSILSVLVLTLGDLV
jgi:hypothetical protein